MQWREDEEYNRLISPRCLSEKRRKEQMCSTGREEAELNWATLSALSSCTISGRFASVNILQCAANALPTLASPVRSIHSGRLVVCLYASPLTPLLPKLGSGPESTFASSRLLSRSPVSAVRLLPNDGCCRKDPLCVCEGGLPLKGFINRVTCGKA